MIDWLFRDRTTGRIVIVQFPNVALWIFIAASVLSRVLGPAGDAGAALRAVATGSLIWWAADEVLRGVNPWRRILGAVVLAGQVVKLLGR